MKFASIQTIKSNSILGDFWPPPKHRGQRRRKYSLGRSHVSASTWGLVGREEVGVWSRDVGNDWGNLGGLLALNTAALSV